MLFALCWHTGARIDGMCVLDFDNPAERVNATPRVLRKHYDVRTEREAMLSRSDVLSEESNA